MKTKIKIVVLAFILPIFMVGCSSDDGITTSPGGVLTEGVTQSGSVVVNDSVLYTITVTGDISLGTLYYVDLQTTSGDADLYVCDSLDCSGYADFSANDGTALDRVAVNIYGTVTLYILVDGFESSNYTIRVW